MFCFWSVIFYPKVWFYIFYFLFFIFNLLSISFHIPWFSYLFLLSRIYHLLFFIFHLSSFIFKNKMNWNQFNGKVFLNCLITFFSILNIFQNISNFHENIFNSFSLTHTYVWVLYIQLNRIEKELPYSTLTLPRNVWRYSKQKTTSTLCITNHKF